MSRKPKKGYFVRGQFVAEGSELDLQLKAELKGTPDASRTDLKRESDELQDLGKELLNLRADLFDAVGLPDKLVDALAEAKRITNFEGKRRQMQYVGKLMRKLEPELVDAARQAVQRFARAFDDMAALRQRAKAAAVSLDLTLQGAIEQMASELEATAFQGYATLEHPSCVLALVVNGEPAERAVAPALGVRLAESPSARSARPRDCRRARCP